MTNTADASPERIRRTGLTKGQVAWGCCFLLAITNWGCQQQDTFDRRSDSSARVGEIQPTSFAVRAKRRAFDGAPPVIPHVPFGVDCVTCHTPTGKEIPTIGAAPANPHHNDSQAGSLENCRQCHLFSQTTTTFVDNAFQGMPQIHHETQRAYSSAPPVTPHSLSMRTNCIACHAGPAARPEILCTHPERTNCVQCHLATDPASRSQQPILSPVEMPGDSSHATRP